MRCRVTRPGKTFRGELAFPAMSGAERNKAYRQRQKDGRSIFAVEQDHVGLVEALRDEKWLTVSEPSHADITDALNSAIADWIERVKHENG
jgi:hypothetical protein